MTFRAKPVAKRSQKPSWESRDRRNLYMNVGFGLAVFAAIAILVIAVAVTYYNDNLAPVGSVDGESITTAEWRERAEIESWRLAESTRRVSTLLAQGRITQAQADLQNQVIGQQQQNLGPIALERIIDTRIQADLAAELGVVVDEAAVDARLLEEATIKESRHAWVIEVAPETEPGALEPTAAQRAAAEAKAEAAAAELASGTPWEEVAQTTSTDASTAPQGGDMGWLSVEDTQSDEAFLAALFALAADTPSTVIEGEDGVFRIGRVTEISPETVDAAFEDKLVNEGIDLDAYREVARADAQRIALEDRIVADATQPGPQREVSEIFIREAGEEVPPEALKVRHILFSPNDDPGAASSGEIEISDPAWAQAKVDADAAFARLEDDPTLFDSIARAESDETSARGVTGSGGKLPGYVHPESGYVQEFIDPIMADGVEPGQILEPFRTDFGWHVVHVMYGPTDLEQLASLKRQVDDDGADFAVLARDNSDAETAGRGGEVGWIARGQLDAEATKAIFETTIGETSEIVSTDEGLFLYHVGAEEVRTPEGRQLEEIREAAFTDWYEIEKLKRTIVRDPAITGTSA